MNEGMQALDWEQLDMIADGYTADFVEIYQEFKSDLPRILGQLEQAIQAGNATEAARAAHQAKGSAANFGFVKFSSLMAEIEKLAKAGNLESIPNLASGARTAFSESLVSVQSERGI